MENREKWSLQDPAQTYTIHKDEFESAMQHLFEALFAKKRTGNATGCSALMANPR